MDMVLNETNAPKSREVQTSKIASPPVSIH